MIKKRNGSSMITVLGVTLVLVFLSGIILKFTMGTMQANTNQKETEDVQFAAEGGLEIAKSYLDQKARNIIPGDLSPNYGFDTEIVGSSEANLAVALETGKITNVAIKSTQLTADRVLLESIATDSDGTEKKIKCKFDVYQANENDIFDYGIVGGQGHVNISNTGDGKNNITSNISSSSLTDENGNPVNNITANENGTNPNVEKNKFGDLTFLTNQPQSAKITAQYGGTPHIDLKTGKFYDESGEIIPTIIEANIKDPSKIIVKNGSDIKEFPTSILGNKNNIPAGFKLKNVVLMNISGIGVKPIEILMTNTKYLELETVAVALDGLNKVILNKGTIEFKGTGSIKLTDSTIYGEEIKADLKLGFHVTGSIKTILGNDKPNTNEDNLNTLIESVLPGWNNVTNSSAAGIDEIKGSYGSE